MKKKNDIFLFSYWKLEILELNNVKIFYNFWNFRLGIFEINLFLRIIYIHQLFKTF